MRAALDAEGALLWWDGARLVSVGPSLRGPDGRLHAPDPVPVTLPATLTRIDALAIGDDGVLYLASGEQLWLIDRRGRALPQALATPGFAASALAARPGGGVWALDGTRGLLARTEGTPFPRTGVVVDDDADIHFAPVEGHPDAARLLRLPTSLAGGDTGLALAMRSDGLLAVLVARSPGAQAGGRTACALHLLDADETLTPAFEVGGGWAPHALAWRDEHTLVLLGQGALRDVTGAEQANEAGTVALHVPLDADVLAGVLAGADDAPPRLMPAGDYLPLPGHDGGAPLMPPPQARQQLLERAGATPAGLAAARHAAVAYARREGTVAATTSTGPVLLPRLQVRALLAVPQPQRQVRGWRGNLLPEWAAKDSDPALAESVIDSHDPRTLWSRLWLEAAVPPGCAMVVWLAASEVAPPPLPTSDTAFFGSAEVGSAPQAASAWWPHLVGDALALPPALAAWPGLPRAAWHAAATEVLGGTSRMGEPVPALPRDGRHGLFEVLVQRAGVAVRTLQGRRLWVVVEMFGNGRDTPTLAALRATGSRFSYRDQYLPALYGEALDAPEADEPASATGSDFLERLLASVEGEFTRIEGAVADAHRLTLPDGCPAPALPWLAQWLGIAFEPGLPEPRRRALLRAMPALWRLHGTVRGLELALELATGGTFTPGRDDLLEGGAVSGGELVAVEHWRLRRTWAAILGAELMDREDPLVAGLVRSGNSLVGDSLLLGDPANADFLALYRSIFDTPRIGRNDPRGTRVQTLREAARTHLYDDLAHRATVLVHQQVTPQDLGLVRRVAALQAPAHVKVDVVVSPWPFLCAVASLVGIDTYLLAGEVRRTMTVGRSRLGTTDVLGTGATLDARSHVFDFPEPARPRADLQGPAAAPVAGSVTLDASRSRAGEGHHLVAYRWRLTDRPT